MGASIRGNVEPAAEHVGLGMVAVGPGLGGEGAVRCRRPGCEELSEMDLPADAGVAVPLGQAVGDGREGGVATLAGTFDSHVVPDVRVVRSHEPVAEEGADGEDLAQGDGEQEVAVGAVDGFDSLVSQEGLVGQQAAQGSEGFADQLIAFSVRFSLEGARGGGSRPSRQMFLPALQLVRRRPGRRPWGPRLPARQRAEPG